MYKVMRCWIFIVIACLFFVGSLDFAEGKSKGPGDRPPGWDKGEKKEKVKKGKKEKKKKDKGEDDGSSDDDKNEKGKKK